MTGPPGARCFLSIWIRLRESLRRCDLARIMHKTFAAEVESRTLTALATRMLLDRVHDYACGAFGHKALSPRTFEPPRFNISASSGLITLETPGILEQIKEVLPT